MSAGLAVLHILRPQPLGGVGGADLHLIDLAEQQLRNGLTPIVLAMGNNAEYRDLVRDRAVAVADVGMGWHPRFMARVASFICTQKIGVIHGHGYSADVIAVAARRLALLQGAGIRSDGQPAVVLTAHGFLRTNVGLRARTAADEKFMNAADAVITTSQVEADRLQKRLRRPAVHYIPNGIHLLATDSRQTETTGRLTHPIHRIAFVGRLSPEKRPDLFLRVAAELAAQDVRLEFVIVGSGPLAPALRRLAGQLGIAAQCRFMGHVHDIGSFLPGVDLLLSLSDTEGTPRAVLEAMSCSVAVIATRVGGLPQLIVDGATGVLVEPGPRSMSDAASAARALLADPARRRVIGCAASAVVSAEFTVQRMTERVDEVYRTASVAEARLRTRPRKGA